MYHRLFGNRTHCHLIVDECKTGQFILSYIETILVGSGREIDREESACHCEIVEAFFTIRFNCWWYTKCRVVCWELREMRVNRRRWLMLPAGSASVGHSNEETWRNAGSLGEAVIYVAVVHTKRHAIDTKRPNRRRLLVSSSTFRLFSHLN